MEGPPPLSTSLKVLPLIIQGCEGGHASAVQSTINFSCVVTSEVGWEINAYSINDNKVKD